MTSLSKYVWLVNILSRAGSRGLTFKEINDKWEMSDLSYGEPIPRQTFVRWKDAIPSIMGVSIECDRRNDYRYYISNPEALESGEVSHWLLDTYTTFDALSKNLALRDRVLVEEIPSSRDYLTDILDAMNRGRVLEISYENFAEWGEYTCKVSPYCLRMFEKRWYMVALNDRGKIRIYGLDRIHSLKVTDETFEMPKDFSAREYFATYFGVEHYEDVEPVRIVLRAKGPHRNYMRSLPLHASQQEVSTCEEYSDFSLRLRPTNDFCYELLSKGDMVEVLEPQSLRDTMREFSEQLWNMYK